MILRVARHTNQLSALQHFYTDVLGFDLLGSFQDHDGYNGIFLGMAGFPWHLEFTESKSEAKHQFDEDDLLVFYPNSVEDYNTLKESIVANNIKEYLPTNPYWQQNGLLIRDPDGYGIIISDQKTK